MINQYSDPFRFGLPVKVKKLHENAVLPEYQTAGAAGFDFHALEDVSIPPGETVLVKTGISFEIPPGFEIQVRPRSGLSLKTNMRIPNAPGTIDSDYRGEAAVIVNNSYTGGMNLKGLETVHHINIKKGDRIAQGVLCPVYRAMFIESKNLGKTERGEGGYGSTDKKEKAQS